MTGGDPDGDPVVYDVYLEANDPTPDDKVADDITETTFDPGTMDYETVYYWRIIAKDNHGASTWGPIWHFTTELAPMPDLNCEGSLSWSNVKPEETVEGSFTVKNIGDPGSLLDWEVAEYPEWGTWNFMPSSGEDLKPEDGAVTVQVTCIAPDGKNEEFTGSIRIINSENASDYCTINVSLSTPKNKLFIHNFPLISWLFERFPNMFPILRQLIGL
ncbi:hypothetical protein MBGDF03_00902 [Thermoplasmatales archaeon SCGC AB-540-F20]|nr:hypothetical protein MBGDF03_00902 [Thermoplasmatales archaeon SCGC AB-540-F20]